MFDFLITLLAWLGAPLIVLAISRNPIAAAGSLVTVVLLVAILKLVATRVHCRRIRQMVASQGSTVVRLARSRPFSLDNPGDDRWLSIRLYDVTIAKANGQRLDYTVWVFPTLFELAVRKITFNESQPAA